jgi:hypothetical protein
MSAADKTSTIQFGYLGDDPKVEMVPTSVLRGLKQGNRVNTLPPGQVMSDTHHPKDTSVLWGQVQEAGGFREPAIIRYHQPDRTARVIEGNHRIAMAHEQGVSHVPARVIRANVRGEEDNTPVRGYEENEHGYVPGDMRPSQIMDWEDK